MRSVAVVRFPGSNCEQDAVHVAGALLGAEVARVWHEEPALPAGTEVVILPGGFSYGDALRSGALASFSPIMAAVKAHAAAGGFVLGICNGFQILLEAGLLPGAMLQNASRKFICKRAELKVETTASAFTAAYAPQASLQVPIAHHEGCYFGPPELIEKLWAEDRVAFTYAEDENGSVDKIAGILNEGRNVLGMMPHPERAAEAVLGSVDGLPLFESLIGAES